MVTEHIHWNTVYTGRVVYYSRDCGDVPPDQLLTALSPLGWEHISHRRLSLGGDARHRPHGVVGYPDHTLIAYRRSVRFDVQGPLTAQALCKPFLSACRCIVWNGYMGLYSTLNTSVSGMAAQASKLGTIGDNIANSSTTGYKRASTEFETLLGDSGTSDYSSGGVLTSVNYGIATQGTITSTTSNTDLAINGNGFFIGQDSSGAQALTRAGSFTQQTNGTLQNKSGYTLLGYALPGGTTLQPINVGGTGLVASPSTKGTLSVNLNSAASTVAAASLPSTNSASATYTSMTQMTAYNSLGTPITLDVYMSKKDTSGNWEVSVYNHTGAASSTANFPYASGSSLGTSTLTFNPATGSYSSGSPISVTMPSGSSVKIDMSSSTQLASKYTETAKALDGSSPASLSKITIGKDGTVTQVYSNGVTKATYQIALVTVASPDLLTPISGNAYTTNAASGNMIVSSAGANGTGEIDASSLEGSTVDLATELTDMISAQRGYQANSKVLQTASDLLGTLNNIRVS